MKKQKQCYNHLLIPRKLMTSVSKITDLRKKKIRTLEKISLLIFLLLMDLIENNNFLPNKARIKRIKTTKEFFGIVKDKNRVAATIYL